MNSTYVQTATITPQSPLSNVIDLGEHVLIAIEMPESWTTASLTFQSCSTPTGTFKDVYDSSGNELAVSAGASRVIVDIPELAALRYLKVRSGTTGTSVGQADIRTINLIIKS